MALPVRQPPSPSDHYDPRAYEYFFKDLYDQNRMAAEEVKTLGTVAAGATAVLTFLVKGALKDKGHIVEYGLPSTWNQNMRVIAAYVSDTDQVSLVVENRSGGSINTPSATYGVRVRP